MRLKFPEPVADRSPLVVQVLADEPLADDRDAWRTRVAGPGAPAVIGQTASGWPLAIVERGRSVLGFYELFDRGVVVVITPAADAFDPAAARALLETADLDRTPREIVALAQLWDGSADPA